MKLRFVYKTLKLKITKLYKKRKYRYAAFIVVFSVLSQLVFPAFPYFRNHFSANAELRLAPKDAPSLYENINPDFKVGFGDKSNPEKQRVRFEADPSSENPFSNEESGVIKSNLLDKAKDKFQKPKGIEFSLVEAGIDGKAATIDENDGAAPYTPDPPLVTEQDSNENNPGDQEQDGSIQDIDKQIDIQEKILDTLTNEVKKQIKDIDSNSSLLTEKVEQIKNELFSAENPNAPTKAEGNKIVNPEIVSGVDLNYEILPGKGLKEDIVIKQSDGFNEECLKEKITENKSGCALTLPKNSYTFELKLDKGVEIKYSIDTLKNYPSGTYYFVDSKGRYLFHFLPLYAVDAKNQKTNNVKLILDERNDSHPDYTSYRMTISLSLDWILDATRIFPVKIDPSIVHDTKTEFNTGTYNRTQESGASEGSPKVQIANQNPYGIYTSPVIDLSSAPAAMDLQWSENGVQTGDGETLYSSTSLSAHWKFNETSGTSATDSSGNGLNLALNNFSDTSGQDVAISGWTSNNKKWGAGALALAPVGTQTYSAGSSGNWTVPANVTNVKVTMWGGGGSGGKGQFPGIMQAGGGGGGGGVIVGYNLAVTPGNNVAYSVGSGGAVVSSQNTQGNAGGNTTFGALTAYGGKGGNGGDQSTAGVSCYGGDASNGSVTATGGSGDVSGNGGGAGQPGNNSSAGGGVMWGGGGGGGIMNNSPYGGGRSYSNTNSGTFSGRSGGGASYGPGGNPYTYAGADGISGGGGSGGYVDGGNSGGGGNGQINLSWYPSASLSNPASNQLDPNSSDLSLEIFIKTSEISTEILSNNNANGTSCTNNGYYLGIDSSGYPVFHLDTNGGTASCDAQITGTSKINDGNYHHLAVSVTRGASAVMYLDGQNIGSDASVTSYSNITVTGTFFVGGSGGKLNAVIDSARIYSRALTSEEILSNSQVANIEFQTRTGSSSSADDGTWETWKPITNEAQIASMDADQANWSWDNAAALMPKNKSDDSNIKLEGTGSMRIQLGAHQTDANTVALWHLEETGGTGAYLMDSSSNANHLTPTGTSVTDGVYGKARSLNGTSSDYISKGGALTGGTAVKSVEFWIYPNSTTNYFVDLNGSAYVSVSSGTISATGFTSPTIYVNGAVSSTLAASQWQHVAVTTGTGINASNFNLGKIASNYLNGKLDEVRISSSTRSHEEIAESYRLGRGHRISKTISSTDLSSKSKIPFYVAVDKNSTSLDLILGESSYVNYESDASAKGLWHLEENWGSGNSPSGFIKDSAGSSHATATGTAQVAGKIGKARSFTPAGSITATITDPGNTNTIEAWVYPSVSIYSKTIITASKLTTDSYGRPVYGGCTGTVLPLDSWTHLAAVSNGANSCSIYQNGILTSTGSTGVSFGTSVNIGASSFVGNIDEVRISSVARTADQIRQTFEVTKRTHTITVDFSAKLDSGNLISNSGDTSFTVDATAYGASNKGDNIYSGDKIIVKENYNGTEYLAQGTVSSVNVSTGAITITGWDSGGTFPSGGYSVNAQVFKWQREYMDITPSLSTQKDGVTKISFRISDGSGRNTWIDDFRSNSSYLTDPAGTNNVTSTFQRYFQYKSVLNSANSAVSPYISSVTTNYSTGPDLDLIMRHGKWFSGGVKQSFWWAR